MDKKRDNNEIPEMVREALDSTYTKILNENIKQDKEEFNLKKHIIIGTSSIAASLFLVLGISIYNPSIVHGMPILSDLAQKIHYAFKDKESLENYTENINESFTSDGIIINIENAIYDNQNILLDFTIKSEKPFRETKYAGALEEYNDAYLLAIRDDEIKINNKKINSYSFVMPTVKFVDEYTLNGSILYELSTINNIDKNRMNLSIDFKLGSYEVDDDGNSEMYNGTWSFEFPIKTNQEYIKQINVNKTQNEFTLNEVLVSPTTVSIDITVPKKYYKKYNTLEGIEVSLNNEGVLWGTTTDITDEKNNLDTIRLSQRYTLNEVGQDLKYLNIKIYGEWNEETKTAPVEAEFKVKLK